MGFLLLGRIRFVDIWSYNNVLDIKMAKISDMSPADQAFSPL